MEVIRFDMPKLDLDIAIGGDLHKGAVNCHHELVRELVYDLKHGLFYANNGDNMEGILPNDKRFEFSSVDPEMTTAHKQALHLEDIFRPVSEQILVWGDGNHELKLSNSVVWGKEISRRLGVPYGGFNYCLHCYYGGRLRFKIFVSHGSGQLTSNAKDPIQREGNLNAALKQKLCNTGISDCVVMAMGHTHQLRIVEPTVDKEVNLMTTLTKVKHKKRQVIAQNAQYIPPEQRWYLNTGSCLRLYAEPGTQVTGYAERRMYKPTDLGWPIVQVRGAKVVNVRKRLG